MSGFENDRKWIKGQMDDVAERSMDLKEKIDEFDEKRAEVEEGISRIPRDLPDELQQQIKTENIHIINTKISFTTPSSDFLHF